MNRLYRRRLLLIVLACMPLMMGADSCGFTVAARVVDATGLPVANKSGKMCDYDHCVEVTTDAEGAFITKFASSDPGRSRTTVRFEASGEAPVPGDMTSYAQASTPFEASSVALLFRKPATSDSGAASASVADKKLPAQYGGNVRLAPPKPNPNAKANSATVDLDADE